MSPLVTALCLAASVVLLGRGRPALAVLLTPVVHYVHWTAALGLGEATGLASWWAVSLGLALGSAVVSWPWLRTRTLGRRGFRRASERAGLGARSRDFEASEFERWCGAGKPRRATVAHRREALGDRPTDTEAALDALLADVDPRGLAERFDLEQGEWQALAASGLLGAGIDTAHGGAGLAPLALSDLVARAASRSVPVAEAIAASGPGSLADLIEAHGSDAQRTGLLPRLARGEALGALAWTGIDLGGADARATAEVKRIDGREVVGFRLEFEFDAVENAPRAAEIAVVLPTFDADGHLEGAPELGSTCFLVPTRSAGLSGFTHNDRFGTALPAGPVRGSGVFVPLDAVLGAAQGLGAGDAQRRWSLERRAGWRTTSIAAGIAEVSVRIASSVASIDPARGRVHEEELGRSAADVVTIDALRRAVCARLVDGRGGALLLGAGDDALRLARDVTARAFEIGGPQTGVRGAGSALEPLAGWLAAASAAHGASGRARDWHVVDRGLCTVALDQVAELDALRAGDREEFDRIRARRHARFAASGLQALGRSVARHLPRAVAGRTRDIDDLGRAFALASEAFARGVDRSDAGTIERAARDLGRTFRAIARLVALEEIRAVDAGHTVQRAIRALAHERSLADGWRGAVGVLDALPSSVGVRWARLAVGALVPARRLVRARGGEHAAAELVGSHDCRVTLTSNVFVPDAAEAGLGVLEEGARLAYAAERPLEAVRRAIAAGQLPALDPRRAEDLVALADEAAGLALISAADRDAILGADALARGARSVESVVPPEAQRSRTSA